MRFMVIQLALTAFLVGIQYTLHRKFQRYLAIRRPTGPSRALVTTVFAIFNVPLVVSPLLRSVGWSAPGWLSGPILPPVYIWHFTSLLLGLLLFLGQILKIPVLTLEWLLGQFNRTRPYIEVYRSSQGVRRFDAGRRKVVRQSLALIAGGATIGSAREIYREDTFDVTDIRLTINGLPPSFENFSIGFISDIHSGIFMSAERMRAYADSVNRLNADLIVVTGDFVNSTFNEAPPLREAFGVLSAPHGVFGVLGNHDFYTRRVDDVAREIERGGISLLRNRSQTVEKGGDFIHLAGIDDAGNAGEAARAFHDITLDDRRKSSRILLCHRPYFFRQAASAGHDLVLSGHTHGGQVVLGGLGRDVLAPARLVSPYVSGLYTEGDAMMYVSRGIGTVGVPFRFNCPPEITRVILTRAA